MEAKSGEGGYPWKGYPLGAERDLGTGRGRQIVVERTRDMVTTGTRCGNPVAGRDLGNRSRTAREVSAGMSGGSRRVGVTSRWTDALLTGKVGGVIRCNREKWNEVER